MRADTKCSGQINGNSRGSGWLLERKPFALELVHYIILYSNWGEKFECTMEITTVDFSLASAVAPTSWNGLVGLTDLVRVKHVTRLFHQPYCSLRFSMRCKLPNAIIYVGAIVHDLYKTM